MHRHAPSLARERRTARSEPQPWSGAALSAPSVRRRGTLSGLCASGLRALGLAALLAGCGGSTVGPAHPESAAPPPISDANLHEVQRAFWGMDPESPARLAWRDALIAHHAEGSDALIERGDYDAIVARLASLAELLTPADLEAGRVPETMAPLARWVVEHGSPRGDEGRVMGALTLLAALGEDTDAARAEHAQIAAWGRSARSRNANPLERFGELIQVWEQHEQLAPTPEALAVLARLYVEQRDALASGFGEGLSGLGLGQAGLQQLELAPLLVRRAPLDVAAVYLRHGDLERAIEHVRRMGEGDGVEAQLVAILQRAQERTSQGATALDELAQGFVRARPTISAAICRLGARRFPADGRFPLCLARVAIERGQAAEATSWYAEAVRLSPDERDVYDEALGQLGELMARGLFASNVLASRGIAREALAILDQRDARFAGSEAPVRREAILLQLGRAEMGAGHVAEAREALTASLAARESADAHQELGLLLERIGEATEAAVHYRQALDLTTETGPEGIVARAALIEDLGDAFRQAGEARQAERMYRQALAMWTELSPQVPEDRRAIVDVRAGILHGRLGDGRAAGQAFERALLAAPSSRTPYAEILAHLVVGAPDLDLAQRVLRRANYQLTLEREWKVYFALWVQAVAARASTSAEAEVGTLLGELAHGESWSARLAAFGHADLGPDELVAAASTPGERAEALFYAGIRSLAGGDAATARLRFEAVLETRMVSFFEYAMAQELLVGLAAPPPQVAETAPPAP